MTLKDLASTLGLSGGQENCLEAALSHPILGRRGTPSFERLEFVGDRVLGLAIATKLYRSLPQATEGEMARRLAQLCSRNHLIEVADAWDIPHLLKERGVRSLSHNIVADVVEAILGAIYLHHGYLLAEKIIIHFWAAGLQTHALPIDPKSQLQYQLQACHRPLPSYELESRTGPDHLPFFVVRVCDGEDCALGTGGSKKEAEINAALELLKIINMKG